jgi:hypothetical protein
LWKHEFTGILFPVIPLTSHRALLFGAPDSFPSGSLLNPVLVTGVAKWRPCQESVFVLAFHKLKFCVNVLGEFWRDSQNNKILVNGTFMNDDLVSE